MKKQVIFYLTYKGKHNAGHRTTKMSYFIYTSKNTIINEFNEWYITEIDKVIKKCNETCYISNLKIIGL